MKSNCVFWSDQYISRLTIDGFLQGRLPLNHKPINSALERGLNDCLSSLQVTNPSILLSRVKLRSIVRDLRYIPKLASEVALCISKSKNPAFRKRGQNFLKQMKKASRKSTINCDDGDDDDGSSLGSQSSDEERIDHIRLADALKNRLSFKVKAKMKAMTTPKKRRQNKDEENDDDDFDDLDADDDSNEDSKSEVEDTNNDKIQGQREAIRSSMLMLVYAELVQCLSHDILLYCGVSWLRSPRIALRCIRATLAKVVSLVFRWLLFVIFQMILFPMSK